MSANNIVVVQKLKGGMSFKVTEEDADTPGTLEDIGTFQDLETALKQAQDFIDNHEIGVEYGISYVDEV